MVYPPHHETLPHLTKDNWREHAAKKKQSTLDAIPKEWRFDAAKYAGQKNVIDIPRQTGNLSDKDIEITEIDDANQLAAKLADGSYTAVDVTTAYLKRAAVAHQLVNCLTEFFPERALAQAKKLDEYRQKNGKTVGPLHGVPISLKDQFDIKGMELTMGYASYLGRISPENACLVDLLEAAGAVLYVRTNIPQTLMIGDTFNHVFGRTDNPWQRELSPGGSSGGEGALVALKGSICGVGTDIGGSVRIPSAMCGLYTIRPSQRRVPYGKATNSGLGQEAILSVAGPMARSMATVELFMRTVLDACAADFDASAMPFPFNGQAYDIVKQEKKLAFGLARTDGLVHAHPGLQRALTITAEALRKEGHEVIDFDLSAFKEAWTVAGQIFAADNGEDIEQVLSAIEEPLIEGLLGADESKKTSVYELHQMNREKEALQQQFLAAWSKTASQTSTGRPIDGLLCPPAPITAFKPGHNEWPTYTCIFNVLDAPATVFPVTFLDPKLDQWKDKPEPYNSTDKKYLERYDEKISEGVPIAVQLVGRRWREEALLALSQRVVGIIGKPAATGGKL